MSKSYFPDGFIQAQNEKRLNGRIFRAAHQVREQLTHSPGEIPSHSPISEVNALLLDEGAFLKAKQEHTDVQQARRQARIRETQEQ